MIKIECCNDKLQPSYKFILAPLPSLHAKKVKLDGAHILAIRSGKISNCLACVFTQTGFTQLLCACQISIMGQSNRLNYLNLIFSFN